ncbi:MAG: biotin/lipoyl-containing protein, partial [Steroidobacteraceae bacterium]
MSIEIRVPPLPESITDATLVAWHKQPGEAVSRDENLADLETDKVVLEVPAPANGVLRELKVQSGAMVKAGDLLAVVEEGAAAAKAASAASAAGKSGEAAKSGAAAGTAPA